MQYDRMSSPFAERSFLGARGPLFKSSLQIQSKHNQESPTFIYELIPIRPFDALETSPNIISIQILKH